MTTTAPTLARAQDQEARYLMSTYRRQPVLLAHGSGTRVWDSEGREYLDLVAGIAVNVLGHCAAPVRAALEAQAATLVHVSNLYHSEPMLEAARLLVESAFPARVFFCNSGAEANEAAIKIARKWGQRHRDGAYGIVCLVDAFHGRTIATLSATGNEHYLAPFTPALGGFDHVAPDDLAGVAARLRDSAVAVFVEPVQGESGVHVIDDATLRALRSLCDENGALLIVDEVQSGMGRTGRWWAHQHAGITPDVMTVAKGLGGGVAIGAVLAAPGADVLEPGDHGSTFGGSPLATAVAAAVLRTIEAQGLLARAVSAGARLRAGLLGLAERGLPVAAVRGRGLMLGVALSADLAAETVAAGLRHGVIVNAIGTRTLRLVPPLTITDEEVDEAVRRLGRALGDAVAGAGAEAPAS
ncbi:MAG TPA: aspartate aminotransferase family protein [Candidatus Dormibacteraeota bacterium]